MILLVSPHLGFREEKDQTYTYGKMKRSGQLHDTSACGAMMGFLGALQKCKNMSEFDYSLAQREGLVHRYHTDDINTLLHRECVQLHPKLYEELGALKTNVCVFVCAQ